MAAAAAAAAQPRCRAQTSQNAKTHPQKQNGSSDEYPAWKLTSRSHLALESKSALVKLYNLYTAFMTIMMNWAKRQAGVGVAGGEAQYTKSPTKQRKHRTVQW